MGRDGRCLITGLTYEVALLNACLAGLKPPAGEVERVIGDVLAGRYGTELPRQYLEFYKPASRAPPPAIAAQEDRDQQYRCLNVGHREQEDYRQHPEPELIYPAQQRQAAQHD